MKPITLYFAGAWSGSVADRDEITCGVKNKLCSYLYPDQFESWIAISRGLPGKIIIDSGAFSAWNRGRVIDIDQYLEYCRRVLKEGKLAGKEVRVVNLDVIPGRRGESAKLVSSVKKEDKVLIEKAASAGYANLCYFLEQGITPIHVFHQGEDFKWIEKIVEKTDYIGISPANDLGMKQKRYWISRVFSFLHKKGIAVKTHGFAVFSPSLLLNFPWTSCDAATWRLVSGYGGFYYPVGGYHNPDFSKNPMIFHITEKKIHEGFIPFKGELKSMLERDGYDYDKVRISHPERSAINLRYFLEFEQWCNIERGKKEYKPAKGFFV